MPPSVPEPDILRETCTAPRCTAAAAAERGHCIAHLDEAALEAWLAELTETGDLDVKGASLSKALLEKVLSAVPSTPDGQPRLRRACLDSVIFESDALFDGFTFQDSASFAGASFRGHARFGAVRFECPAVFAEAAFGTHAWFLGTTFAEDASFAGARLDGPVWLGEAVFEKTARFDGASFGSDVLAPDAKFQAAASFVDCKFRRKVRFDEDAFVEEPKFDGTAFDVASEMPASVKAEARRLAGELAPVPSSIEEALPPPPPRTTPPPRRQPVRAILPWLALGALVLGAGFFVTRGEGTKADFVPFARGDESAFRFLLNDPVTGRPTRYNPCQVLSYVVNPELGPADWRPVVLDAMKEVARATGLRFKFAGVTDEIVRADLEAVPTGTLDDPARFAGFYESVFNRPSVQPERYGADKWAPILIGWAVLGDTPPDEDIEVLGVGASDPRMVPARTLPDGSTVPGYSAYVTGTAVINTNVPRPHLKTSLMHEIGHVLGLAHIQDDVAIMRPNTRKGAPAWSAGDLAGLRKVGRPAGCLEPIPPAP